MLQIDKTEKLQSNLHNLAFKVLNKYASRVEMVNTLHNMGLERYGCMVLELILLGKDFTSIKRTLLFSDTAFQPIVLSLIKALKDHDKNIKLFKKLKGV
jgi:hypothetical protein